MSGLVRKNGLLDIVDCHEYVALLLVTQCGDIVAQIQAKSTLLSGRSSEFGSYARSGFCLYWDSIL